MSARVLYTPMAKADGGHGRVESLLDELRALFDRTEARSHDERACILTDWLLARLDASRCALLPVEAGVVGPPMAFRVHGRTPADADVRQVPRKVVQHVLRTRQPVVAIDARDPAGGLTPSDSMARQQVGSYMAVPVLQKGQLIGICYLDRFQRPGTFTADEQATFAAVAYELARPLAVLREQRGAEGYRLICDEVAGSKPAGVGSITSPAFERVLEIARGLAPHREENLLILGETGVGKEVLARLTHELSGSKDGPFVPVNIGAISPELFESELMGSRRGAFTGALDRPGWITLAEGGTLFLDEIGDLSLANQVKLLRFLQDKHFTPVGSRERRQADVRVVAATNRDLAELARRGEFRADLLHRFAPPLRVPPLRERREEILPLRALPPGNRPGPQEGRVPGACARPLGRT